MLPLLQANYLSVLTWVITTSARASIFIIFLLGVKFILRHKMGPRFRYMLWSVLILGLILPCTPNTPISIDPSHIQQIIASIFDRTTQLSSPFNENYQSGLKQTVVDNSNYGKAVISTKTRQPSNSIPFIYNLMFFIWFSGVLTFTVLTVIVNKRFSEKIEDDLVTDQRLLSVFKKLKVELNIKSEIPLLNSRYVSSPSLLGIIHPRLLLPIGIEQIFTLEQLNHIFLHELLHYKRKDIWVNGLTQVLIIIHWFNPLVWYAFFRMREDQEISCDALAISRINTEQPNDYAFTLVKLAETYSTAPKMVSLASLGGPKSQIKRRLIMIRNLKKTSVKWSLLGVVVIGLIAFATFTSASADTNSALKGNTVNLDNGGLKIEATTTVSNPSTGITTEDITGPTFKGKVMLIKDPKRIKVAVTKDLGVKGEKVSDLVKDMGAIAGINAGGFYNPEGKGNGAIPDGLTMYDGKLVYNRAGNSSASIVGFNDQGKLVIGDMTAKQLEEKNMREVVSFAPNLIVNGKPVISGDGVWGIAPRTGIGQMADGTVIFVVIDGRQPTWSIGATLNDLTNIFADYHAVNASNLDGGSSSEMVYQGKVLNRPCDVLGEQDVPTAFVVTS